VAPKDPTETAIPAPLKALGGWPEADWFSPSVVSDHDVFGLVLPKLPGGRKQSFRLVERSTSSAAPANAVQPTTEPRPKHLAARLGLILDSVGVLQAAAFRRTTLLFATPPVLFFADIPLAKLKARSANKLRRDLIDNALFGCILHMEKRALSAMFWHNAETEITDFIEAAAPPHPLHQDFIKAERKRRAQLTAGARPADEPTPATKWHFSWRSDRRPDDQAIQLLESEKADLLHEIAELRKEVEKLRRSQSALGAMEQLGLDDAQLKSMLRLLHPDKHGNSEAATEAAKWLNNLRDQLREKKPL